MVARKRDQLDLDTNAAAHAVGIATHIRDLQAQIKRLAPTISKRDKEFMYEADKHLKAAKKSLRDRRWRSRITGKATDRAIANVREVEVTLLRFTPESELRWKVLDVLVQARLHLKSTDARLQKLEELEKLWDSRKARKGFSNADRELLVGTLHAAYQEEAAERSRLSSFTTLVFWAAVASSFIAIGIGIWVFFDERLESRFCFPEDPDKQNDNVQSLICPFGDEPSWQGVWFVEFAGMLAAAVAGAVSLRKVRGSSTPYHVATSLLLLRLPVGALTAVLGIMLLSGKFFPGLTALDTPTQIIAWAMVFGVLQEVVTRMVDQQGRFLLDNVNAPGRDPEPVDARQQKAAK
jgi:hypothetical protein